MGRHQIATLARFTVLEAARTRLMWLFVIALALILCAALFIQQLAITEGLRMQIAFSAAASRLAAVFVLSLYILTSLVREFNDKGLELTLSFDLRRADYIFGKLLGFIVLALVMALLAGVPQALNAPLNAAIQWSCSLALELTIIAALSVFCMLTFTHLMPAASFVAGFYVLSRAMSAIQLISANPIVTDVTVSQQVIAWIINALAMLLPTLDQFTASSWLVQGAVGWSAVGICAVQALLYTTLLVAAAMFDFYRRNL